MHQRQCLMTFEASKNYFMVVFVFLLPLLQSGVYWDPSSPTAIVGGIEHGTGMAVDYYLVTTFPHLKGIK